MHLSLEQLLAVRDGEATAEETAHAAACPACAEEVERLRALRAELAALPAASPSRDVWPAVSAGIAADRTWRRIARLGWAAAALAAGVTLVVGVRGGVEAWHEARAAREMRTLIAESQRLERALHTAADGGRVESGRTANTIVEIEDRIATIDAQLTRRQAESQASPELIDLWHERVRLLDALVNVRATHVAYVGL
ncbi:MAG TPA: hypothetical protein VLW17_06080 [Thermoanaerobaculaceae bacterium]|nr:hypothetical protein [Thermoanaerobaculaceae bacterium]